MSRSRWLTGATAVVAAAVPVVLVGAGGGSSATAASGTTIVNCGVKVHVAAPPSRAISLNQGATELMLTLGLQKRMAGTAYLDDAVLPSLLPAYKSVPVIAKEYPSAETFLSKKPDFAVASYASAFDAKEGVGTRSSLARLGVGSYLLPDGCNGASKTRPWTFADNEREIRDIGTLFGVRKRAASVVGSQRAVLRNAVGSTPPGKGLKILWWDSETKAPVVGACCGGPNLIMKAVGATNVFSDVKGNWKNVSWETALARRPDVIVIVNASWDTASAKIRHLAKDKALSALPAVARKRFVVIPFSDSTPGVRNVYGVRLLAAGLRKLHLNG